MLYSPFAKKIPLNPPFSKGEFSPWDSNPSLEKRGRGDFRTSPSGLFTSGIEVVRSFRNLKPVLSGVEASKTCTELSRSIQN